VFLGPDRDSGAGVFAAGASRRGAIVLWRERRSVEDGSGMRRPPARRDGGERARAAASGSAGAAMLILLTTALGAGVFVALATGVVIRWSLRPSRARADAGALGLPVTEVSFDSASGARLAGWFAEGRPQGGAVALMHGVLSSRQAMAERMRFLNAAGFAVLAFDLQAHGESGGRLITFGRLESLDARAAIQWLRARLPGERIGAVGISLGGAAALLGPEPLAVDALVLEAVFPDIERATINRVVERVGGLGRLAGPLILRIGALATGLDPAALRPIEAIGAVAAPILVMAGTADPRTTIAETRELFDRARPPKDYWEVAGAGHVDLCDFAGADYRRRLLAFFERHLR
jgi:fermentation-respiration switch protein FrsA (DUF1100 family)